MRSSTTPGIRLGDLGRLVLCTLLAFGVGLGLAHGLGLDGLGELGGAVVTAGFNFPVMSKSINQLRVQAGLDPVSGGDSQMTEAVPWVFYDTQLYTSAATVNSVFFAAAQANRALGNVPTSGQLPEPQFFELYYHGFDVLVPVVSNATGVLSAWDDVQKLVIDSLSRFQLTLSDKAYGPFPLSFLHASGGVNGFGFNEAAAGAVKLTYGQNGIFDGGWCWNGAVTIPPSMAWQVDVTYNAAQTLIANRQTRMWLAGVLHRRVL